MYAHCHGPVPDPRSVDPAIPEACSRIIARAMAKASVDRYQSTAEMLADLQAVLAALSGQTKIDLPSDSATVAARTAVHSGAPTCQQPVPGSRRRLLLLAAGVVIVAGVVAAWLARMPGRSRVTARRARPTRRRRPGRPP